MTRKSPYLLCGLFSLVAGTYFTLQCLTDLVWDDTPSMCSIQYDCPPPYWHTRPQPVRALFDKTFGELTASGYRPVNALQQAVARWHVGQCGGHPFPWYAGGAVVFGLFSVVFYRVARRFTSTWRGALLAVFLLFFSTPVITGGWPVVCNCQATVPLALCGGLLVYWRLVEPDSRKPFLSLCLSILFLVGPWIREFVGLLPVLILAEEVRRKRRPTWVTLLAVLGFAHALYPTAVLKWIAYPELPLAPVFRLGNLGGVLHTSGEAFGTAGWFAAQVQMLKWDVPYHFLVLVPPCLLLLTFASLLVPLRTAAGQGPAVPARPVLLRVGYGACLLGYTLTAVLLFKSNSTFLGLWLVLAMTVIFFRIDLFIALWFLLSFLPFLRAFTEQVHLAYALVPASIGMASSIERVFQRLSAPGMGRSALRVAAGLICFLGVSDHALNLYSSFYVVTRINEGIHAVATWFTRHTPPRSVVICNALHAEDIRLACNNHFTAYWTVSAGIPHPSRDLSCPETLESVLSQQRGLSSCYFLDVAFDYRPDKVGYHSHKYVREQSVPMKSHGRVHVLRARYPFLDPLKHWIPRHYLSFLGPPDLENDYYTGPAQNHSLFFREVYAEYHVYAIVGSKVDPPAPSPPPLSPRSVVQSPAPLNLIKR